jgi:hypothetical protein
MAYFNLLSQHFTGNAEENCEIHQDMLFRAEIKIFDPSNTKQGFQPVLSQRSLDLKIGKEVVEWIEMAEDRIPWRAYGTFQLHQNGEFNTVSR